MRKGWFFAEDSRDVFGECGISLKILKFMAREARGWKNGEGGSGGLGRMSILRFCMWASLWEGCAQFVRTAMGKSAWKVRIFQELDAAKIWGGDFAEG